MKKQALKAVTMLVSIIALAFMTAMVSSAQSRSSRVRADIPFDFVIGNATLEAGKYDVGQITTNSNDVVLVSRLDGSQSAMRLTNGVDPKIGSKSQQNRARLTFHRYGSTYYLAQIWMPGSPEARELLKSKAEKAAERELAKNPSRNEVAQNAQSETVTIFAELQ